MLVAALALAPRRASENGGEWRLSVAGAAIVIAPWQLWVTLHDAALPAPLRGSYGSYTSWFATGLADGGLIFVGQTIARNSGEAAAILADRFAPWHPGMLRLIPLTFALTLLVLGIIRLRRRTPITVAFLLAYVVVTLIWPYTPWRFIWGIWPFVLLLAVEGADQSCGGVRSLARRYSLGMALFARSGCSALGLARAEVVAYRDRAWAAPFATRREASHPPCAGSARTRARTRP